jgi:hypothetical protein
MKYILIVWKFVSVPCADVLQELESLKSLIIWLTLLVVVAIALMSIMLAFVWKRERKIPKLKNGGKDSYFKKKLAFLKVHTIYNMIYYIL